MVAAVPPKVFTVTRHEVVVDGGVIPLEQLVEHLTDFNRLPEVHYRALVPVAMPQGTAVVPVPLPDILTNLQDAVELVSDRTRMQPLVSAFLKAQSLRMRA